jgi:CheY-like chemotaxis protein
VTADGRVLVVDDDDDLRDMLSLCLETAGFEVATAVDGLDALRRLRAWPPQVIVLDLRMPRMNGVELIRIMKREPALAGISIIVVTGDAGQGRVAIAAGASESLLKPVDARVLIAAVTKFLSSSAGERATPRARS